MDEDSTPEKADASQEDAPAEAAAPEEPSAAAAEGAAQKDAPSLESGLALLILVNSDPSSLVFRLC